MHLIFIRHGDPDYEKDFVTEKGRRELELLSERFSGFDATEIFVSPMGRAKITAEYCTKKMHSQVLSPLKITELPWLREFDYRVTDPRTGKKRVAWDFLPRDYFSQKKFFSLENFFKPKIYRDAKIKFHYDEVCRGFDEILSGYDYNRVSQKIPVYNCLPHLTTDEAKTDTHLQSEQKNLDEKKLVFVCHLGVMFVILSHLTGISPVQLWQGFFVAPSSVTILGAEERVPGEVVFRIQRMGDVNHLLCRGENASASGFFGSYLSV
jgi:probable phosphoglycerate mutase